MDEGTSTTRARLTDDLPAEWITSSGLTGYEAALAVMAERAEAIRAGHGRECVWMVEHPPLYTAGTSARAEHLLGGSSLPTFRSGRGGQWTYHGPGQRIVYLMMDLKRRHGKIPPRDLRAFVAGLESWMIAALARFGIRGEQRDGRIGIWVINPATGEEEKIAAIGVRVSRWVTTHGLALNVAPNLDHYAGIVPCGISEHGVTSLAALGVEADFPVVDSVLRETFDEIFGTAAALTLT